MGDRLMVGQATLDRLVGVRIPVPQLSATGSHPSGWEPVALDSLKTVVPRNAYEVLDRDVSG